MICPLRRLRFRLHLRGRDGGSGTGSVSEDAPQDTSQEWGAICDLESGSVEVRAFGAGRVWGHDKENIEMLSWKGAFCNKNSNGVMGFQGVVRIVEI